MDGPVQLPQILRQLVIVVIYISISQTLTYQNTTVISLSVRITGSDELKSVCFHQRLTSDCVITHDLLDQSNVFGSVGLVKEQHSLHARELDAVALCMHHSLADLALYVNCCRATMYL